MKKNLLFGLAALIVIFAYFGLIKKTPGEIVEEELEKIRLRRKSGWKNG